MYLYTKNKKAMIRTTLNRRDFLKQSSAAALSFAYLPHFISKF
jgi:hypothetical protein